MDRVILITGGSRGIGAAIARQASADGYAVGLSYSSNRTAADAVVAEIEATGGKAVAFQADVALETDVMSLFAGVDAAFGRLDALVNNAGILETQMRVEDMSAGRIQRVLATNV